MNFIGKIARNNMKKNKTFSLVANWNINLDKTNLGWFTCEDFIGNRKLKKVHLLIENENWFLGNMCFLFFPFV